MSEKGVFLMWISLQKDLILAISLLNIKIEYLLGLAL